MRAAEGIACILTWGWCGGGGRGDSTSRDQGFHLTDDEPAAQFSGLGIRSSGS